MRARQARQAGQQSFVPFRLAAAALAAAAIGATAPAQALTNATATAGFDSVGNLGALNGVLVASNWVLTAAHVASGLQLDSSTFSTADGSSVVDAVYTFSSAAFPANDIALVHLASGIASGDLPVLNDVLYTSATATGLAVTLAAVASGTQQEYGDSTISNVVKVDSESKATVNWLVASGGSVVESGDSGSALFLGDVGDSAGATLLGIASAQVEDGTGRLRSAYVQVAAYKSWIDSTLAASGQSVVWASAVPEPASLALTAVGGLMALTVACRRRAG